MIENLLLHHIMYKMYDFFFKFINFEQKGVLGLGFSEKYQSEANKIWQAFDRF